MHPALTRQLQLAHDIERHHGRRDPVILAARPRTRLRVWGRRQLAA